MTTVLGGYTIVLVRDNIMLFKCSCERRLIAASESATAELGNPEQWRRTRAATQALSLTQLNGMPNVAFFVHHLLSSPHFVSASAFIYTAALSLHEQVYRCVVYSVVINHCAKVPG
ncbi:MAG: hypothetical protein NVSMB44_35980 [Ktedonobacteraceae bacterium]